MAEDGGKLPEDWPGIKPAGGFAEMLVLAFAFVAIGVWLLY